MAVDAYHFYLRQTGRPMDVGLVKGLVRIYSFSLCIFIAYRILICADPCPEHG